MRHIPTSLYIDTEFFKKQGLRFDTKAFAALTGTFARIPLPDSNVVDQFSKSVEPIFKRQDLLERENHHLAQFRDWLLPLLMNGQVTVAKGESGA